MTLRSVSGLARLPCRTPWRQYLLCCFIAIVGLRVFIIERYGASVPWVDEWQATGQEILQPWKNGTLSWAALFEAHNGDHRIVATRLWEIFWYTVNGAWDPKLVMIAKAAIYAAAATIFIHLFTHALPRRRFLAATILAALFAFPFNFHNLLWAFQSQFDFFLLCTATGWLALLKGRPGVALIIAGISPFTLGAGAILAASYVPFCVWAWRDGRWSPRKTIAVSTASMVIAVVALSLRAEHAAPLATPREQAAALATYLAWPHSGLVSLVERLPETERLFPGPVMNFPTAESSWLRQAAEFMHANPAAVTVVNALCALLLLAPTLAVAVLVARRQIRGAAVWGALGLAGFAFLMQVATGIARAKEIGIPIRYLDFVALSAFAALACAFVLVSYRAETRRPLIVWAAAVVPACLVLMVGKIATIRQARPQMWLENVRQYFPTHDHAIFHRMIAKEPEWCLPFISRDIEHLMAMLDDPEYLEIVPRSVIAPEEPPRVVARVASAFARSGLVLVVIGAGAGTWIVLRSRRREGLPLKLPQELGHSVTG